MPLPRRPVAGRTISSSLIGARREGPTNPGSQYSAIRLSGGSLTEWQTMSQLRYAAGPTLFVIAGASSSMYNGRVLGLKQVAYELGARYLVEGSLRRAGNRVRISVKAPMDHLSLTYIDGYPIIMIVLLRMRTSFRFGTKTVNCLRT
jgi:hypothetical protein